MLKLYTPTLSIWLKNKILNHTIIYMHDSHQKNVMLGSSINKKVIVFVFFQFLGFNDYQSVFLSIGTSKIVSIKCCHVYNFMSYYLYINFIYLYY